MLKWTQKDRKDRRGLPERDRKRDRSSAAPFSDLRRFAIFSLAPKAGITMGRPILACSLRCINTETQPIDRSFHRTVARTIPLPGNPINVRIPNRRVRPPFTRLRLLACLVRKQEVGWFLAAAVPS